MDPFIFCSILLGYFEYVKGILLLLGTFRVFVYFWLPLKTFVYIWVILDTFGSFWVLSGSFGSFGSFGYFWVHLSTFGSFGVFRVFWGLFQLKKKYFLELQGTFGYFLIL